MRCALRQLATSPAPQVAGSFIAKRGQSHVSHSPPILGSDRPLRRRRLKGKDEAVGRVRRGRRGRRRGGLLRGAVRGWRYVQDIQPFRTVVSRMFRT